MAAHRCVERLKQIGGARSIWDRAWIPIGAGLALLAMMGTGPQSDLAGHALGFLFGMLLSAPVSWYGTRWLPRWAQAALQLICLSAMMLAWRAALKAAT